MHSRIIVIPLLLTMALSTTCRQMSAQDPDDQVIGKLNACFDEIYRLDQKLISGIQYYNKYPGALGNEFFDSEEFIRGRLVINGLEYNDVDIRYDIYNQRINLRFKYNSSAMNTVIIERYKIDEFNLGDMIFRKHYFPETDTALFQIVTEGKISCLYYWYKNLTLQTSKRNVYEYSEPRRKNFLLFNSELHRYKGKQSFIKLFAKNRSEVRKYLRQNQIRLRDVTDREMGKLIEYCISLSNTEFTE
jgi:hypothetical protein